MGKTAKLLEIAKSKLGTDFTPNWQCPDELSCAFAVSTLLREVDPSIPIFIGTSLLDKFMTDSPLFEEIRQPIGQMEGGWIVMSATGSNSRPDIMPHGHCGIYANETEIMSNDSNTGLWLKNYTRDSWRNRYYYKGGYPTKIYKFV